MEAADRRVLFVVTGLARGGAELEVLQLAERLAERGWTATVVSLLPVGEMAGQLEKRGVKVVSLEARSLLSFPYAWLRLVRLVRNYRPVVVHAHMFHANIFTRLVRLGVRVPALICTAHSIYEASSEKANPRERTWREWAYRLTDPLCDLTTHVCAVGRERYVRVKAVPEPKIRVVPNGVDTDRFFPSREVREAVRAAMGWKEVFVWISVGRFAEVKDHRTLLQAFARLDRGLLVLVGSGPLVEDIRTLAGALDVGDRVQFLGTRDDIPELLNAADAYVISSRWEGLPMALLEAQACGLPVVATRVGGVAEVVSSEDMGILVPPGDPEALACAMGKIMDASPRTRAAMGAAARSRLLREFSLDRVVELWEGTYRELISTTTKGERRQTGV